MSNVEIHRSQFGPHGKGASIAHTIVDSPHGRILVAAAEGGMCALYIGGSDEFLEAELRRDFHAANLIGRTVEASRIAQTAVLTLSGDSQAPKELHLHVRGTAFQLAVWRELCAIPSGTTRTYGEIARRIGRPNAARAVGHAGGRNPVSILIPCHRAVGSDGSLTGYRWGLERKRALLTAERSIAASTTAFPID